MKKIIDIYNRECTINEAEKKLINYNNAKKEIVYNAPIFEDGKETGFFTDYIEHGVISDIETRLETWNNAIKFEYAKVVNFDSDHNDADKKIWGKCVAEVKAHPEKYFFKNGNFRKNFIITI